MPFFCAMSRRKCNHHNGNTNLTYTHSTHAPIKTKSEKKVRPKIHALFKFTRKKKEWKEKEKIEQGVYFGFPLFRVFYYLFMNDKNPVKRRNKEWRKKKQEIVTNKHLIT